MTVKKSIGWTDMTCNPIKGECQGGCWYCYTKPMYKLGRLKREVRLELMAFASLPKKKPKKVFLCSTHDLFGDWIPREWRDLIFKMIQHYSHHTFQILTKFPQNIDRPMPDNVWLGCTITNPVLGYERAYGLLEKEAKIKFISLEPLLGGYFRSIVPIQNLDWVIVGKLTGHGKKHDPLREDLERIVSECQEFKIPTFMKDNLRSIWGEEKLMQEMPEVK